MKKLLLSLITLAVSAGLSLLVAELLVRWVRPQPRLVIEPGGFYVADPPGRYRLNPGYRGRIYNRAEYDNEIRINGAGLRGPEVGVKDPERRRVLVIGDSFVFGVGVEDSETFVARLSTAEASRFEGLNAGIPAFGVPDAASWLARHGVALQPDVVLLSIFQGNDLVDASPDQEEILVVDGLLVPGKSSRGLKAWLHRHSHLYVLFKSFLEIPNLMPLREKLGLSEPWKVRVLREEFGVYSRAAPSEMEEAIAATDQALGELVELGSEQGFVVLAVLIPSEVQVDPVRWSAGLRSLGLDHEDYDPQVPTRIFAELLERHAIATLDLGPIFAAGLAAGEELYFHLDRHWTSAGHAKAAEAIASFVDQHDKRLKKSPAASLETSAGLR